MRVSRLIGSLIVALLLGVQAFSQDTIPSLIEKLGAEEYYSRSAAADSLAKRGKESIPHILKALKSPNAHRRQGACQALGKMKAAETLEPLLAMLDDPDTDVQSTAAWAAGAFKSKEAVPALLVALEKAEPFVRLRIIPALGYIGDSRATNPLMAIVALEQSCANEAAIALGAIGDPLAIDTLAAALAVGKHRSSASHIGWLALGDNARDGLVAIGKPAVPALIRTISSPEEWARARAVEALAAIRDERGREPAFSLLSDKSPMVRTSAASAMGAFKEKRAVPILIDWLAKPSGYAYESVALDALGNIGDPRALDAAVRMLASKDSSIRRSAVDALAQLGQDRAGEPLMKLLSDSDHFVREAVMNGLAKLDYTAALPKMKAILERDSRPDSENAARALADFKTGGHEILIAALKDTSAMTRQNAVTGLGYTYDKKYRPAIASVRNDKNEGVRSAAGTALWRLNEGKPKWAL